MDPATNQPKSKSRVDICLLASHPAALREMRRALPVGKYEVRARALSFATAGLESGVPVARVYVIDIEGPLPQIASAVAEVIRKRPTALFIAVAETFNETNTFPMLRLGIKGIVEHAALERQLMQAVETVTAGGYWVPRIILSDFVSSILRSTRQARLERSMVELSRREQNVMDALLENCANKEIAARLGISERTVKFHVSNVLRKFHVGRRADLILLGVQNATGAHWSTGSLHGPNMESMPNTPRSYIDQ